MRADLRALLDQADAATAHGERNLRAIAAYDGGQLREVNPHELPVIAEFITDMTARALRGQLTFCRHLTWTSMEPTWWVPYRPGRLRCVSCVEAVARGIKGTAEDSRCDACHRHSNPIMSTQLALPAAVLDLGPDMPAARRAPIIVSAGLCDDCFAPLSEGVAS